MSYTCPICGQYVDPKCLYGERVHVGTDNRARILRFHYKCELKLIDAEKQGQPLPLRLE